MKLLIKCIVPVFALALVLGGVPGYAAGDCTDSPSVVILPDCTTVLLTTCYCEASDVETEEVTITDLNTVADVSSGNVTDCAGNLLPDDGSACASLPGQAADVFIDDVVQRRGQGNQNSTPAKNGKGTADITCDDCDSGTADADGESVDVSWDLDKKNNHYDIVLSDSSGEVCTVGFNVHRQSCDP